MRQVAHVGDRPVVSVRHHGQEASTRLPTDRPRAVAAPGWRDFLVMLMLLMSPLLSQISPFFRDFPEVDLSSAEK